MLGYHKNPQATKEVIDDDGYFHTGDIGYYDESGKFHIVDRLKELIKVRGFQVRYTVSADSIHTLLHQYNINKCFKEQKSK